MKYDIIHRPSFSLVEVELDAGERIKAEPGAMVSMSDNIQVETETGGVFKALSRVVGGESLFMNTFYADGSPGTIELAPPYTGDIEAFGLECTLYARAGLSWHQQLILKSKQNSEDLRHSLQGRDYSS